MSTNTPEQNFPVAGQMFTTYLIEFVPNPPSFESHDIDSLETAVDEEHSLDFETLDLTNIVNIDNSSFTDTQVLSIHQHLKEHLLAAQAILRQLIDDTALSVKELQHEIDVAKRSLQYREVLLGRYSQGWRSTFQKVVRRSKLGVLRREIENYKEEIKSMERIQRLVRDNEAARLLVVSEEVEVNLERVQAYEAYSRVRGLVVPSGVTVV
jgi:hypothetical protein